MAASIRQSGANNTNLILNETTLLPSIRGFGPMMAALFCPKMEMKRDREKSRIISILTGLGYDKDADRPLFEEHDSVFHLDVEFDQDDFHMVRINWNTDSYFMDACGC